jgi:outer membrane protein assembly factor BamB
MFRNGPERRGWYPDTAAPQSDRGWTYPTGGWIKSSPVLAGDTAYVGSLDGTVHAVDLRTGRPRWARPLGAGIDGSPAVSDGAVYVGAAGGRVFALDAGSGDIRWTYTGAGGGGSSPAVAGGLVILGGANHELLGLDAPTGRLRWSYPTGARLMPGVASSPPARGALDSSPLVIDGTVYLSDGELHAVALATGSPQWTAPTVASGLCSPAAADGLLYVAELGSYVRAVETGSGRTRWRVEVADALFRFGTPAIADGLLLVCAEGRVVDSGVAGFRVDGGLLVALDAATGEERWRRQVAGRLLSSPAAADGLVHVLECADAGSALVTVDSATGTEVRRRALPGTHSPGHSFVSSPSVAAGAVYVGTVDGVLVASTPDSPDATVEGPPRRRWWRRGAPASAQAHPGPGAARAAGSDPAPEPDARPEAETPPARGKHLSQRDRARLRQLADREAARALAGLRSVDRSGAALAHSSKAIATIERLYADDPDAWVNAEQLAGKLYNHAALLELMGRTTEAADAAQRSLTYYAEALGGPLPPLDQLGAMYQLDRLRHRRVDVNDPDALRPPPWEFAMLIADAAARLAMLLAKSQGGAAAPQVRRLVQIALNTYQEMARVEPRYEQGLVRAAGLGAQALRYIGDKPS